MSFAWPQQKWNLGMLLPIQKIMPTLPTYTIEMRLRTLYYAVWIKHAMQYARKYMNIEYFSKNVLITAKE